MQRAVALAPSQPGEYFTSQESYCLRVPVSLPSVQAYLCMLDCLKLCPLLAMLTAAFVGQMRLACISCLKWLTGDAQEGVSCAPVDA